MTLDDAEKLAREQLSGEASADSHVRQLLRADKLARFIMDVLPVVRAAESWRAEIARKPRPTDAEVTLANAIDAWHAAEGRKA